MTNAQFRITFPIAKAEQREDGFYLIGEATGPEVDSEGERMAPEAIERFAAQITERAASGDPLVYRDAHKKDGVLRDLGVITRAWLTDTFHLGVEVKLDEDNPAAMYLWRKANDGKKFGMSVAGRVLSFADEFAAEVGRRVRTYKNVVLDEISNTTRPAWTPSLGTVLAKAIDEADDATSDAEGDNTLMSDELRDEQETQGASAAEETEKADASVEEEQPVTDDSTEKAEETVEGAGEETTEKADEDAAESTTDEDDVEKAGRKFSTAAANKLLGMYAEIGNTLKELGLLEGETTTDTPEKSVSEEAEGENVDKADETPADSELVKSIGELRDALAEANRRIEELEKNRTVLPPVIERATVEREQAIEKFMQLPPMERLRIGLAARHGELADS